MSGTGERDRGREQFEEWAINHPCRFNLLREEVNDELAEYKYSEIRWLWEAWQAAYAAGAREGRAEENEACASLADECSNALVDVDGETLSLPKAIRARQQEPQK